MALDSRFRMIEGGTQVQQPIIEVEPMSQQTALNAPEDDWTGQSSPAERRKRQNRINQRAHRKRKVKQIHTNSHSTSSRSTLSFEASSSSANEKASDARDQVDPVKSNLKLGSYSELWRTFYSTERMSRFNQLELDHPMPICTLSVSETQKLISQFEKWVKDRMMGYPQSDLLLTLVKFNVFRALISNSITLGFSQQETAKDDALSPFTDPSHHMIKNSNLGLLPTALQPTPLQCKIPHHPWIDELPIPGMRDNLLRAGETYDDIELCGDLVGFFNSPVERTGMIIWGDPWDPAGWEVTLPFLEHWGWTVRGCKELFESTNRWRARRGEKPMRFHGYQDYSSFKV